jgi:hypothetical protein
MAAFELRPTATPARLVASDLLPRLRTEQKLAAWIFQALSLNIDVRVLFSVRLWNGNSNMHCTEISAAKAGSRQDRDDIVLSHSQGTGRSFAFKSLNIRLSCCPLQPNE